MDLKRIKYLIQVADFGSFSRAAAVIGIAQPALGRQVQKLEAEYGNRLLYRHGRGVSLTPEGEKFLDQMRPLVREFEAAFSNLREERASPTGVVTLGLTPTLCKLIGMPLLASLRKKFPKLRINVVSGYSGYIHEWLAAARLDLAILHDARRSQHVAVEHIADVRLFLMSAPHLVRNAERPLPGPVPLEALQTLPLVLPTRNHGLRRTMDSAASRLAVRLDVQYEMDNLDLMKEIALAGLAHTVLAPPAVQDEIEAGRLMARPIVDPEVVTRLMLVKASSRPATRAVQLVEHETRAVLRQVVQNASVDPGIELAPALLESPAFD